MPHRRMTAVLPTSPEPLDQAKSDGTVADVGMRPRHISIKRSRSPDTPTTQQLYFMSLASMLRSEISKVASS